MSGFVNKLKVFGDFVSIGKTDEKAIKDAENKLNLLFSEEYREYLRVYGAASADGHEFTGIVNSARLNVVDVTMRERNRNESTPKDLYVVEEAQIDGIVIWQSSSGKVYKSVRGNELDEIATSLSEYLQ